MLPEIMKPRTLNTLLPEVNKHTRIACIHVQSRLDAIYVLMKAHICSVPSLFQYHL